MSHMPSSSRRISPSSATAVSNSTTPIKSCNPFDTTNKNNTVISDIYHILKISIRYPTPSRSHMPSSSSRISPSSATVSNSITPIKSSFRSLAVVSGTTNRPWVGTHWSLTCREVVKTIITG